MEDDLTEDSPRPRKPNVDVGVIGKRSPVLGAAMLGMMMAASAPLFSVPAGYSTGASAAKPSDLERMKKAHARRERRQAARPNARISPPS